MRVGMKVKTLHDFSDIREEMAQKFGEVKIPEKGTILTIREIDEPEEKVFMFRFQEVSNNPTGKSLREPAFAAEAYAPLWEPGQVVIARQDFCSAAFHVMLEKGYKLEHPHEDDVLTVREVLILDEICYLRFEEIHNEPLDGTEPVFVWHGFQTPEYSA